MALINCPECKAEISDSAYKCPRCAFILRKPQRTAFGKFVKFVFWVFNIFMLYSLFAGVGEANKSRDLLTSEAELYGHDAGVGLGAAMIITFWAIGAGLLGIFLYFTRPKAE